MTKFAHYPFKIGIKLVFGVLLCFVLTINAGFANHTQDTDRYKNGVPNDEHLTLQATPERFYQQTQQLLKSDEYSQTYRQSRWELKNPKEAPEITERQTPKWLENLLKTLESLSKSLGIFGKVVLLLLLVLFVVWIIYNKEHIMAFAKQFKKRTATTVMPDWHNLPSDNKEPLPSHDEIANLVANFFAQKNYIAGMSLLYRGSLRLFKLAHHLSIDKSKTEAQCQALLVQVAKVQPSEQELFVQLVALWQMLAYGGQIPDERAMYAVLERWRSLYDAWTPSDGETT